MKKIHLSVIIVFLAGCSSSSQWVRSDMTGDQAMRQQTIDSGYCTSASQNVYQAQPAYIPPGQPNYQTQGVIVDANGRHHIFNATTSPQNNAYSQFAQGYNTGAAIRAKIDARRAQSTIYNGCMTSRGWTSIPRR